MNAFMTMPYTRSKEARVGDLELWVKKLCTFRDVFRDVVLVVADDDGNVLEDVFLFLARKPKTKHSLVLRVFASHVLYRRSQRLDP